MSKLGLDISISPTHVEPGGQVRVACSIEPWPDPKGKVDRLDLAMGFRADVLELRNESDSLWVLNMVPRETNVHRTTGTLTILPSQIDQSGHCSATLAVPSAGPPSALGFRGANWSIDGRLVRRYGTDAMASAPFDVGMPSLDTIRAMRPPADDRTFTWVSADAADQRDLSITVEQTNTDRGEVIHGEMILELDPLQFAKNQTHLTKRGTQKALEKADLAEVEIVSAELTLQCWRCGPSHMLGERDAGRVLMASETTALSLPGLLSVGEPHAFPFEVKVPAMQARMALDAEKVGAGYLPPTWYGPRAVKDTSGKVTPVWDDRFVWELAGMVKTKTHKSLHGYSGENPSSPLHSAIEVLIT